MSLLLFSNNTVQEIVTTVESLSPEEQKRVLLRLRKGELMAVAKRLAKSVKPNNNTSEQTGAAVKKWRKTA